MNKKGFTLVELLAVLVVIGLITGIAVPSVVSSIKASRRRAAIVQEKSIIEAAKNFIADDDKPSTYYGTYLQIEIAWLIEEGYLKDDMAESVLESEYADMCVKARYSSDYNQWEYEIDNCSHEQ